jgi:hypothetical protein
MLVVETIAKIRRTYFVQKKAIKEICRELKVSRKTVRRVVRSGATEFVYERKVQCPTRGPFWKPIRGPDPVPVEMLTLFIAAAPNAGSVWVRVVDEVSGASSSRRSPATCRQRTSSSRRGSS